MPGSGSSCACSYLWREADGFETPRVPCEVRVAQRARVQKSKSQARLRPDYCHYVPACCQYGCQPQLGREWQLVLPVVNTRPAASTLYPAALHDEGVNQLHFLRLMARWKPGELLQPHSRSARNSSCCCISGRVLKSGPALHPAHILQKGPRAS